MAAEDKKQKPIRPYRERLAIAFLSAKRVKERRALEAAAKAEKSNTKPDQP